jgi:hypothetical protein
MAGERKYTRIPPASTGPKINLAHTAWLPYTNLTGGESFVVNEDYTLATSGIGIKVISVHIATSTTGTIEVLYDFDSEWENLDPSVAENIQRDSDATVMGQVASGTIEDLYYNKNIVASADNPTIGLIVDRTGAANVRFAEGQPQLDAFGKLRVSGATPLGDYVFNSNILPEKFSTWLTGSSTATWESTSNSLLLTNTIASGDEVHHTSNLYHRYIPGSSHLFLTTVACGDVGKTNLVREWGLFDDENGYFFRLSGTAFQLVVRSNTSGSITETVINQSAFNKDRVNGLAGDNNISLMNIDPSKNNIYWIDVQWLGAGTIRFGTYYQGQRITMHEVYFANTLPYTHTATASLPISYRQRNTGSTGSTSEMRAFCAGVWTETTLDIDLISSTKSGTLSNTIDPANNQYQYIGSFSPSILIGNRVNRTLYSTSHASILAYDSVTGNNAIVEVSFVAEPVLSNTVFTVVDSFSTSSTVEKDINADYYLPGQTMFDLLVKGETHREVNDVSPTTNYSQQGGLKTQLITGITQANPGSISLAGTKLAFREPDPGANNSITITGVSGMTEINSQEVFLKITSSNTALLYTDNALTTPLNTSGYTAYTSGGTASGLFGDRVIFSVLAKPLFNNTANLIDINVVLSWRELTQ